MWDVMLLPIALILVVSYLLGSLPFGFLVGRAHGVDIRSEGSGNIGATNVFRVVGRGWGLLVFALDFLKGLVPVLLAPWLALQAGGGGSLASLPLLLAGLAAILGHNYPCWLGFRGGKGVATSGGALVGIMPWVALVGLVAWLLVFLPTRYVSLASIVAALALPVAYYALAGWRGGFEPALFALALVIAALAVWRHRGNIARLLNGTEHRMTAGDGGGSRHGGRERQT